MWGPVTAAATRTPGSAGRCSSIARPAGSGPTSSTSACAPSIPGIRIPRASGRPAGRSARLTTHRRSAVRQRGDHVSAQMEPSCPPRRKSRCPLTAGSLRVAAAWPFLPYVHQAHLRSSSRADRRRPGAARCTVTHGHASPAGLDGRLGPWSGPTVHRVHIWPGSTDLRCGVGRDRRTARDPLAADRRPRNLRRPVVEALDAVGRTLSARSPQPATRSDCGRRWRPGRDPRSHRPVRP